MKYTVRILPQAERELDELYRRLLEHAPKTALLTKLEFRMLIEQLEAFPFAYQRTEVDDVRRAPLHASRHNIYYRVRSRSLDIIAVLSQLLGDDQLTYRGVSK
jgi:plasmid stabilization system protein ParE